MSGLRSGLGRGLQLLALLVVGLALVVGLVQNDMAGELLALGLGAALFLAGRLIEPGEGA